MEEVNVLNEEEMNEALEGETLLDPSLVDENGEELLFSGGPRIADVEEWKSQYGEVFLTEFPDEIYIWRTISRKEYRQIMSIQNADSMYKEEKISETCVLFPKKDFMSLRAGKAGIPAYISELVMEKSGFTAVRAAVQL